MVAYVVIAQGWAVAIRTDLKEVKRLVKDLKGMGYETGYFARRSVEDAEEKYAWWNYTKQQQAADCPPPIYTEMRG